MKVGTHEKSYRTFVGNAIYVSVPGLIDPRVTMYEFIEQRSAIKFYVRNEISAAKSLRMLQKAFGYLALSETRIL